MLCLLCSCGMSQKGSTEKEMQNILSEYDDKASIQTDVTIEANLGEQTQTYEISYQHEPNMHDHLTILQPETVSGIEFTVSGDENDTITYEDTVLQTGMAQKRGLTPADAVSVLIQDIQNRLASEYWTEETDNGTLLAEKIASEEDGEKVSKDIYFDRESGALRHCDIYADNNCILQLDFKNFTWNNDGETK